MLWSSGCGPLSTPPAAHWSHSRRSTRLTGGDGIVNGDGASCVTTLSSRFRVSGFAGPRSEEHTSELQSLMRISYAVFCLKKKKTHNTLQYRQHTNTQNTTYSNT